jgi:hypothetical protein
VEHVDQIMEEHPVQFLFTKTLVGPDNASAVFRAATPEDHRRLALAEQRAQQAGSGASSVQRRCSASAVELTSLTGVIRARAELADLSAAPIPTPTSVVCSWSVQEVGKGRVGFCPFKAG